MKRARSISRRKFLAATAVVGGAMLAAPWVARAQAKKVTWFTQGTYTDPKLIGHFTKETGIELVVQNFGDVEQLAARLTATGGSGLDVASCPNNLTQQFYKSGVFTSVDSSRLKNWNKLFPEFQKADFLHAGSAAQVIGMPFAWGMEALIYRTDKIPRADSWNDLWDERWKGRVTGPDYSYEWAMVAALVLGYKSTVEKEPIVFTDAQLAAIKTKLIQQKRLITKYWQSTAEGASLVVGGEAWISVGRLAMVTAARQEKVPVKLVAPKEGAQGWCTSACVLKSAANNPAVYEFLDWMASDSYQRKLSEIKGYPSVNKPLMAEYPQALRDDLMLGDPNLLTSMVWWKQTADTQRINNMWNEVKAS
jgi:spermidine/putrescine transport system substrate-binding protein